jgi:2'-hydroxyisoflavone reductase
MLYGIKAVTTSDAHFIWVDADFLDAQKVAPWGDMPVWVPPRGDEAGFTRMSIKRALEKGLTFRPLAVTARDTLDWFKQLPAERQAKLGAGIAPQRETEVLAAWRARKKPTS